MLDHISIGVRDLARSTAFYDAALKPLGITRLYDGDHGAGYGAGKRAQFWLNPTDSPAPRNPQSGCHICFHAENRDAVQAFHALAISHGGEDDGGPGIRPQYSPGYYAAFVCDPDGYRIEAVTFSAE
ncbi:VOC family protein [Ferrovibrio sp.]|uniref:VOC family protein n=1 Tax=Ferrovibrio sp. TaxID=1917215 RepID=UPI00311FC312